MNPPPPRHGHQPPDGPPSAPSPHPGPRIVIIGAGFGGIAAAVALTRAGFGDVVLLERAAQIGGVWRDNAYPGCACDVPAPLYSFSFALNPHWSRRFPPHSEILGYLRKVADDHGVTPRVRLRQEVIDCCWDEAGRCWRITTADGSVFVADVLVPATGQLGTPVVPALPGSFGGPAMHTARWDPSVPIEGRRVGVLGTGASAIQLVPAIAGRAAHVTVFQRTPPWTLPRPDRRYGRMRRLAYARVPALMKLPRAGVWALTAFTGRALLGGRLAGAVVRGVSRVQLRMQVRDRRLRVRLTPDFPMGCKRVLFTSSWLPALSRPDVTLVTDEVVALDTGVVRTAAGDEHPCDVLVYATGFAATDFLAPIRITGRDGVPLSRVWRDGAHAYLGITVPGFPNMFLMYGPNTNTGNTSVLYFHEAQARYLVQAVRQARILDVRPEVATAFDTELQSRLATTVWTACRSWYRTATGRIVTNWPGSAAEYRRRTARLDPTDFR